MNYKLDYWQILEQKYSFLLTNHFNLVTLYISKEAFFDLENVLKDENAKTDKWDLQVIQMGKDWWYELTSFENNASVTLTKDVYESLRERITRWKKD